MSEPEASQERLTELLERMYPQLFDDDDDTDVTNGDSMLDTLNLAAMGLSEAGIEWLENNELSADNVDDFASSLGTSQLVLLTTAEVRDQLCTDQENETLITFNDPETRSRVVGQLCNLTFTQFEELVNDVYLDSADGILILGQVCGRILFC